MSPCSTEIVCYTLGLQVPIISLSKLQILNLVHWNLSPSYSSYPFIMTLYLESSYFPSYTCLISPLEEVLSELQVIMALLRCHSAINVANQVAFNADVMVAALTSFPTLSPSILATALGSCLQARDGAPLAYFGIVTFEVVAFLRLFKGPRLDPSFKLYQVFLCRIYLLGS